MDHSLTEADPAGQFDVADEVVEGVVDGAGVLMGPSEAVEVGQNASAAGVEVEVELAAAAELEEVQGDAPPGEEASGVGASLLDAGVGEAVEPGIEVGEEVADGLDEGVAGDQGRPALSLRRRARARRRATERR